MPPNNSPSVTPGASGAATPYFHELAELASPVPDYAATLRTQEEDANDANVSFLRSQPGVQGESSPRATSSPLAITAIAEVVPGPNTEDVGRIRRGLGSREIRHRYTPAQLQELGTLHESTFLSQDPGSRAWVPESSDDDDDWDLPVVFNPPMPLMTSSASERYSYRSIRQDLSLLPPTSPSISESSTRATSLPEDIEASEPATASDSSLRTAPLVRSLRLRSQLSSRSTARLPHYLLEGESPGRTSDGPGRPIMLTSTQPTSSNSISLQQGPPTVPILPLYNQPQNRRQQPHTPQDLQLPAMQHQVQEQGQQPQEAEQQAHQYTRQHEQQQPPQYQPAQSQLQQQIQRQVQRQQRQIQAQDELRQLQLWHEQRQQQRRPPPLEPQPPQQLSPAEQQAQRQAQRQGQLQVLQQAQVAAQAQLQARQQLLQAQRQVNQLPQAQRQPYISPNLLQAQQAAHRGVSSVEHYRHYMQRIDRRSHQQPPRLETYRQRYLENPTPNPPSSTRSLDDAIKYLGRLRFCESEYDRFLSAKAGGFKQEEYLSNTDFILDTSIIGPPPQSSWLMIGAVFSGSQHAASSSAPAGYRGYPTSANRNPSPAPPISQNPVPPLIGPDATRVTRSNQISDPSSGDIPQRRSDGDERWPVKVTIHSVDYDSMTLSGTMEAFNVPDKTSPTRESSISTFLEGEILDFKRYTLETKSFKANAHVDGTYWRELAPFRDLPEEELVKALVSKKWLTEELSKKWILMRWKEKCFVTPTDSQSSLTISGFYYVSLRREDGHVEGLYYDPSSTPYQHLSLMPKKRYFPAYEFQ